MFVFEPEETTLGCSSRNEMLVLLYVLQAAERWPVPCFTGNEVVEGTLLVKKAKFREARAC